MRSYWRCTMSSMQSPYVSFPIPRLSSLMSSLQLFKIVAGSRIARYLVWHTFHWLGVVSDGRLECEFDNENIQPTVGVIATSPGSVVGEVPPSQRMDRFESRYRKLPGHAPFPNSATAIPDSGAALTIE